MGIDADFEDGGEVPKEVIEYFSKIREEDKAMKDAGIYIDFVKPIIFEGKKVWALGNTVYHGRKSGETFHEFIISILILTLGEDWWKEQEVKAFDEKHFIAKCYSKYIEWQKNNSIEKNRINEDYWGATPDGWTRSLLSLAFDVASLRHVRRFPDHLLIKLKRKEDYQSARYEISIAAIFARLNFDIDFLDVKEEWRGKKHCEFIAMHKQSKVSIAIEAKSRHRKGIIHTQGSATENELMKGDVGRLLNQAKKQNVGNIPFMIFVDINSPATPEISVENKKWFRDIQKLFRNNYATASKKNPDEFNLLVFTNFSHHYQTDKEAEKGEYFSIISPYPKFPISDMENHINAIISALNHYGNVLNIDLKSKMGGQVKYK